MKMELQRFAGDLSAQAEAAAADREHASPEQEALDRQRRFQALIQGEYRQEFEDAVGRRIRAAIQQRFRNRQETEGQTGAFSRQETGAFPRQESAGQPGAVSPQEAVQQPDGEGQQSAPSRTSKRSAALRQHFAGLVRQAEELRRSFPDFDLMEEMQNPAFVRMTAPGTGISVKDAFYAVHGEEIQRESMEYAARQAGDRIAASVQAGASRPLENGMQSLQPADTGLDIRHMDRQAREAYRRRIKNGESIDFVHRL